MWVEAIKSYRGSIGMILSCRIQFHINQQSYTIQNTVKRSFLSCYGTNFFVDNECMFIERYKAKLIVVG